MSTGATRVVGRYEILRELGRGGAAVVYLAHQLDLDRRVALKELSSFHASDPAFAERFLRESRLAGSLSHPNLVTVHDYFECDGVPYIAMELLERGSLRPQVRELTQVQAVGVLEGALAGLTHAESHAIVHRDLKPENMMVTGDGRVKIADFGIAKAKGDVAEGAYMTATGTTVGTPAYMAPEQATASEVGPQTDLYSLGVMAFEMLTGDVPFSDPVSPMAVLLKHVREAPPPVRALNPNVDERLEAWVARLLEKDPADRPATAADAWDELEDVLLDVFGPRWRREARIGVRAAGATEPEVGRPLTPAPFHEPAAADDAFQSFVWEGSPTGPPNARAVPAEPPVAAPRAAPVAEPITTPEPVAAPEPEPEPAPTPEPAVTPAPEPASAPEPELAGGDGFVTVDPHRALRPPARDEPASPPPEVQPEEPEPEAELPVAPPPAPVPPPAPATLPSEEAAFVTVGGAAAEDIRSVRDVEAPPEPARPAEVPAPPPAPVVDGATMAPRAVPPAVRAPKPDPPTAPRPARDRRRPVEVAAVLAAAALGAGLGALTSGGGDPSAPAATPEPVRAAAVRLGPARVVLPAGLQRTGDTALPGGGLEDAAAAAGTGGRLVVGLRRASGPALAPDELTSPRSDRVAVAGVPALRYRGVPELGGPVVLVPLRSGVLTAACVGTAAFARRCEAAIATLVPAEGTAQPAGPSAAFATALGSDLAKLGTAAGGPARRLAGARTRKGQASSAAALARAYGAAVDARGAREVPRWDAGAQRDIVAALRDARDGARALGRAAGRGDGGAYARARTRLRGARTALARAVAGLSDLGYGRT